MGFSVCHWVKKDQRSNSSPLLVLSLLLLPSLRLRLMLMPLFSMELMDMVVMLLLLTPMDMLHMLNTPMLLDMLVPMVLTLMLELMVPTTLARGLLMLSPRLMLSMVPMDTLHMVLLLMPILDTVLMVDTHTLMVHIPPMVLIPTTDKKENLFQSSKNNHNCIKKTTARQKAVRLSSRSSSQPVSTFQCSSSVSCRDIVRMLT